MSYYDIKKFRKIRKSIMIAGFGGKCQICGYNKCNEALEFHHLNPSEKDFALSRTIDMKWDKQKEELKKCICVCANCHREIHQGLIEIDTSKQYFNEELVKEYSKSLEHKSNETKCPICGKNVLNGRKYCSIECSAKANEKVNWNEYGDIVYLIDNNIKNINQIAIDLNISWNAVKKRYNKLKKNI